MRWVIGDIHGMRVPLEAIVDLVGAADGDARFYFVGDYVNRGPDSRRAVEFLLSIADVSKFVRGNHDDVLDLILNDAWSGGEIGAFDPLAACSWFLHHGLDDTLNSYGVDPDLIERDRYSPTPVLLRAIREAFADSHKQFFRALPTIFEEEGLLIAHAFWPPEESNDAPYVFYRFEGDAEFAHRVIWERWTSGQIISSKPWRRPAFFGHTPVSNYPPSMRNEENVPVTGPMITLLDTGVALSPTGRLSAVCVEDGRLIQVDRRGDRV